MTRDTIPTDHGATRRRAIALGAMAALILPACASSQPRVLPSDAEASAPAPAAEARKSPPLGYPWATGPSLPTASANSPTVAR